MIVDSTGRRRGPESWKLGNELLEQEDVRGYTGHTECLIDKWQIWALLLVLGSQYAC